jgi:hypothetical protein
MMGRLRESELVETPPHRAEFWFFSSAVLPSPRKRGEGSRTRGKHHAHPHVDRPTRMTKCIANSGS